MVGQKRTLDKSFNKFFMKIKFKNNLIKALFCFLLLSGIVSITLIGCKKEEKNQNSVYITQAVNSSMLSLPMDATGSTAITVASSYVVNEDVTVNLSVDTSYLKTYNETNHTNYVAYPVSSFSLSAQSLKISSGQASSNQLVVTVNSFADYNYALQYAIPVKITTTSNSMPSISGQNTILLTVTKSVHSTATKLADNDANNAQEYTFDNNKIFAQSQGVTTVRSNYTIEGRFMVANNFTSSTRWFYSLFEGANNVFLVIRNGANGGDSRNPGDVTIAINGNVSPTLTSLSLGTWYHFALVYDSKNITVYINGKNVYQAPAGNALFDFAPEGIASFAGGTGMAVSEYRVWKTMRSAKQISLNQCIIDPKDPDLLAYWRFDQTTTPTIVKDLSGNGNDLKKGNATVSYVPTVCP